MIVGLILGPSVFGTTETVIPSYGSLIESSQIENAGYTSSFKQDKQTVYKSFTPQPVTSSSNYGATVTTEAADSYGASLNGS